MRAVLRRLEKASANEPKVLRQGEITLDRSGRITTVGGRMVDLTPSEFDLLSTLMSAPGRGLLSPGAAGSFAGNSL